MNRQEEFLAKALEIHHEYEAASAANYLHWQSLVQFPRTALVA
ncbi:hypothetical protein SAMN04490185_2869 [Pseudomonas frederiksbergensis]|uniref:Uncharacterized protein n=1 Tax=Pseudomonas frederiksbergensis TaxID=104087 RepID=A0A1H4YAW0_9PSED|nr:hypothetical protein SAMN04490185_2869 [Pseudomonas frederiksbergensis]